MLVFNTTRPGLNDARVRRALAFSIDHARIAEQAMSKYSDPASSSLILPTEAENPCFDRADIDADGWRHDPAQARQILEDELGEKKDGDVHVLADGTRLEWKLQTPTGWTDWQTAIRVVAESAGECGFKLTLDCPEANQLTPNVQTGNFDLVLWYIGAQTTAATPWQRFRDVMDIRGVNPIGENAFYSYGRFSDPHVGPLLDTAATATGDELQSTLRELDTIFMLHAERPDGFAHVPPAGLLRAQRVRLDRLPRRRAPDLPADLQRRRRAPAVPPLAEAVRSATAPDARLRRPGPPGGTGVKLARHLVRKLAWYAGALVVAVLLNFPLPRLMPGNPVDTIVSTLGRGGAEGDQLRRVYESYSQTFWLDRPLWEQFLIYIDNLLHGDLGISFTRYPMPVCEMINEPLRWTVGLQLPAVLIGWIVGNLLGAVAAYRGGWFDRGRSSTRCSSPPSRRTAWRSPTSSSRSRSWPS